MLLAEPSLYFREILRRFPNSYLAEDGAQVIIGIDCVYIEGDDFAGLEDSLKNGEKICEFAGLFGVVSWNAAGRFEHVGEPKSTLYEFPTYFYADARAYLQYDKQTRTYSFYGPNAYLDGLDGVHQTSQASQARSCDGDSNLKPYFQIVSNLKQEREEFGEAFEKAREYIASGDAFQIVLSRTLVLRSNLDPFEFYERLKTQNPSHYMYYFPTPHGIIAGSSPELVMKIKSGEITVSPIAGTRPRGRDANEDERLKEGLLADEKELAEHRMLVDLARNDVGKFARAGSVKVRNLMRVEFFESVMHITSDVIGSREPSKSNFDVLSVVFPAGTLSGSPKIRAMQIINELEPCGRGIYGGGIGFWHYNGDVQMAILIRSAIFVPRAEDSNLKSAKTYDVFVGAGYGQVFDSDPEKEYQEICNKRKSCVKVFEQACEERK